MHQSVDKRKQTRGKENIKMKEVTKWLYMQMLLECRISQCAADVKCLNDSSTWTRCAGLPAWSTARSSFFCLENYPQLATRCACATASS